MVTHDGTAVQQLIAETVVSYRPSTALALGDVESAIFVHQLLYWTKYTEDGWVYRTQAEITERTALSVDVQARVRLDLVALGVLEEKRRQGNRLFYRIDQNALENLVIDEIAKKRGSPLPPMVPGPSPLSSLTLSPLPSPSPPYSPPSPSPQKKAPIRRVSPEKTAKKAGKHTVPDDFAPLDGTIAVVLGYPGVTENDVKLETPLFVNHHQAKGNEYVDWQAAFRKWMANVSKWRTERKEQTVQEQSNMSPQLRAKLERDIRGKGDVSWSIPDHARRQL